MNRKLLSRFCLLLLPATLFADVPKTINHQGLVTVNGTRFNGTGHFRFAIFDPDTGVNYWTNDNTSVPGPGIPTSAVNITVTDGVYSVLLGDTSLSNMTPIQLPTLGAPGAENARLRIWFDDGVNGNQQLTPDHPLAASPYTHQAQFQPPIGSIMAWHKSMPGTPTLPEGWVECNGQPVDDARSPYDGQVIPNLNGLPDPSYTGGRFLRGGAVSGVMQEGSRHYSSSFSASGECLPRGDGAWVDFGDGSEVVNTGTNYGCTGTFTEVGQQFGAYEHSKPVNMSVVWIMRVK